MALWAYDQKAFSHLEAPGGIHDPPVTHYTDCLKCLVRNLSGIDDSFSKFSRKISSKLHYGVP